MTEVFFAKGCLYHFYDVCIRGVFLFEHLFQIYFSIVKQTDFEMAVCREPDAIASATEVLAHAANIAELTSISFNFETF